LSGQIIISTIHPLYHIKMYCITWISD